MVKKKDENEIAYNALQELLNRDRDRDGLAIDSPKNDGKMPCRVKAGRKGGKIGGLARSEKLTEKQRHEIAQKAAKIRWENS